MIASLHEIEQMALRLPVHERLVLLDRLRRSVQNDRPSSPRDVEGTWRELFPDDFDIDEALREIRGGWLRDEPE